MLNRRTKGLEATSSLPCIKGVGTQGSVGDLCHSIDLGKAPGAGVVASSDAQKLQAWNEALNALALAFAAPSLPQNHRFLCIRQQPLQHVKLFSAQPLLHDSQAGSQDVGSAVWKSGETVNSAVGKGYAY